MGVARCKWAWQGVSGRGWIEVGVSHHILGHIIEEVLRCILRVRCEKRNKFIFLHTQK